MCTTGGLGMAGRATMCNVGQRGRGCLAVIPRVRRGGRFTKRPYGCGDVVHINRVTFGAARCQIARAVNCVGTFRETSAGHGKARCQYNQRCEHGRPRNRCVLWDNVAGCAAMVPRARRGGRFTMRPYGC